MKRILFIAITMLLPLAVFAQTAEECYNKGKSFNDQKDYTKAMEWYLKAANQGHAQAQVMIGWYYKNGYAVEANTDKALDWYLKAAKQGYAQAQYLAGAVYNDRKDYTNAAKWYQKAADQDHASGKQWNGIRRVPIKEMFMRRTILGGCMKKDVACPKTLLRRQNGMREQPIKILLSLKKT